MAHIPLIKYWSNRYYT